MCRICGRTIKCIFDSMPSRTLVQRTSRRAFTKTRTPPTLPTRPTISSSRSQSSPFSLTASFSTLRLSSQTPLTRTTTIPTIPFLPSYLASSVLPRTTARPFSTTPITLGHRRRMDTFSPSRRVQKRRHGFLARLRTKNGRKTLKNRRLRGRKDLSW